MVVREVESVAAQPAPRPQPQNGRLCFPQADIQVLYFYFLTVNSHNFYCSAASNNTVFFYLQVQPAANGGAVLSVILPPAATINHHGFSGHSSPLSPVGPGLAPVPTTSVGQSLTMMSSCSAQYVEVSFKFFFDNLLIKEGRLFIIKNAIH